MPSEDDKAAWEDERADPAPLTVAIATGPGFAKGDRIIVTGVRVGRRRQLTFPDKPHVYVVSSVTSTALSLSKKKKKRA